MPPTIQSRIFLLSPSSFEAGLCGVCSSPAILKARDASTGLRVGICCVSDLLRAEAMVTSVFGCGLRHPTLEESHGGRR